jgi:4-hydroxy-2-oxoheptanedioate aldolase
VERFRRKMGGDGVIGTFSKTSDPAFIEIIGYGGFDFVVIDLEHGPNSVQSAQNLIRAAQVVNLFPVVRVKEFNLSVIGETLDIGAGGVQVPQVTDPECANESVRRAKFAPEGSRGVCRFVRAAGYSSMSCSSGLMTFLNPWEFRGRSITRSSKGRCATSYHAAPETASSSGRSSTRLKSP